MPEARSSRKEELLELKPGLADYIKSKNCAPLMIRLAWHDSGSYDKVGLCPVYPIY